MILWIDCSHEPSSLVEAQCRVCCAIDFVCPCISMVPHSFWSLSYSSVLWSSTDKIQDVFLCFLGLGQEASEESKTACILASFSWGHGTYQRPRRQDVFVTLIRSCGSACTFILWCTDAPFIYLIELHWKLIAYRTYSLFGIFLCLTLNAVSKESVDSKLALSASLLAEGPAVVSTPEKVRWIGKLLVCMWCKSDIF